MTTEARYDELSDAFEASTHAVNEISGDRLICCDPEDGPAGEVEIAATVLPKPPGVTFWRSTSPEPSVTLTRRPSGEVTQQLTSGDHPVAVTDTQAAAALGVGTDVWTRSRDAIESGLARIVGGGAATTDASQERQATAEPSAEVLARLQALHTEEMQAEMDAERLEDADLSGQSKRERAAELRGQQYEIEREYGLLPEDEEFAEYLDEELAQSVDYVPGDDVPEEMGTPARVPTDLSQYRDAEVREQQLGMAAALTLGVPGHDPAARRQRLAEAVAVRESWNATADAAYAAAHWTAEPDVPQPFGLGAVIRAEGDIEQALGDAEVRWQIADRLELTGHMTWVQDEVFDGHREEWQPDISDTPEGRREIDDTLARIAHEVGVSTVPPAPAESTATAADQPTQLDVRPALVPPNVSPPRPEQMAPSPGLSAPGPGIPF